MWLGLLVQLATKLIRDRTRILLLGKPPIAGSSHPEFWGNKAKYNYEIE
jgi:hypothetical protein